MTATLTDAIAPHPARRRITPAALQAVALLVITFCAYLPTLGNRFIWDDDRYIEQNKWLGVPGGLSHIWFQYNSEPQYYPLTHTTFWVEHCLWGLNPFGYHLDNLLLQITNTLLLWRLLVRLQIPGACFAAAFFAVHPVQVETVAWATERKNVLSAFFYFLSFAAYLKTHIAGPLAPPCLRRVRFSGRNLGSSGITPSSESLRPLKRTPQSQSGHLPSLGTPATGSEARAREAEGEGVTLNFPLFPVLGAEGQGEGRISTSRCTSPSSKTNWPWYFISLLLFTLALLSKSVTSSLPAVILLLVWWKRGFLRPQDFYPLIPFFLLGLAMGVLTGWMEKYVVGAIGPEFSAITPADRLCIAGRAVWFYLWKLLAPAKLTFIYPRWDIDAIPQPRLYLFPASVLLLFIALWLLRRRITRSPLCAALFFVGTLFPALGFVNVFPMRYSFVADHFQYLACIGPFVLFAAGTAQLRFPRVNLSKIIPVLVIPLLAGITFRQTHIYKDRLTLWQDTVRKNPASPMAHNNLAGALRDGGQLDAAEAEYHTAINLRTDQGDYIGLGQCFALRHDYNGALAWYRKSLANTPDSEIPLLHRLRCVPWFQIGTAYDGLAQQAEAAKTPSMSYRTKAIVSYSNALGFDPGYPDAHIDLSVDDLDLGDYSGAINEAQAVLDNDSTSVPALNILGAAYARQSRFDDATGFYRDALKIDSTDVEALVGLGIIEALKGNLPEARQSFESALEIDPNNALAKHNLNAVLAKNALR
jgi:tetratricopeptide (TPR) repeat protein